MGELARKPGCLQLAKSPVELVTPRPGEGFTLVDKWGAPVYVGIYVLNNLIKKNRRVGKPLWEGLPIKVILSMVTFFGCYKIHEIACASRVETYAVLKHYMTLHPDDFPPYDRKRWKDVYLPFSPIR